MNTNVKTCLFGGALLGAGLCSSASAGDVNWNFGSGNAHDVANNDYDFGFGPNASWDADTGTGVHSRGGDFGFDVVADATGTPYNYAYAWAFGSFNVATDTTFSLSWNVYDAGFIELSSYSGGAIVSTAFGSGSIEYTFLATETYVLFMYLYDFDGEAEFFTMGDSNVNVVPLPPAAFGGLAMLAGLGAYRRVRR